MKYPFLTKIKALEALKRRFKNHEANIDDLVEIRGEGETLHIDTKAIKEKILELDNGVGMQNHQFEGALVETVHQSIQIPAEVVSDKDFWTWLNVEHFFDIIQLRFGKEDVLANEENFGLSGFRNSFIPAIWFRGEIAFDERYQDPYSLAKRGTKDFWKSHILRVNYGSCRTLAKELIKCVYPDDHEEKPALSTKVVRTLAKKIHQRYATTLYEYMSEPQTSSLLGQLVKSI